LRPYGGGVIGLAVTDSAEVADGGRRFGVCRNVAAAHAGAGEKAWQEQ
jgi:hypothetical protein